jgi:hypothetical protein
MAFPLSLLHKWLGENLNLSLFEDVDLWYAKAVWYDSVGHLAACRGL